VVSGLLVLALSLVDAAKAGQRVGFADPVADLAEQD
jgi:hypothetical protein